MSLGALVSVAVGLVAVPAVGKVLMDRLPNDPPGEKKPMSQIGVLRYLDSISERSEKMHDEFLQLTCDFKMQRIDLGNLITKVEQLFRYNRDLIQGFNVFLPRQYEIPLPILEKKPTEIEHAVCFVDSMKEVLSEEEYNNFLRYVNMHRLGEMSVYRLYRKVTALLKSHRDLQEQTICFFFDHNETINPRSESPKSEKRSSDLDSTTDEQEEQEKEMCTEKKDQCLSDGRKDPCKPFSVPEILKYQGENPSYKFLPEVQRPAPASGGMELDASVLNDGLISEPYEGYSPKPKRQSLYEERWNLLEDDMFEMDMLLGSMRAVNELVDKIKANETANKPQSPISIGAELSCLNLRCIERLYGPYGLDMLDALHKDPGRVLPIIAARLKQKAEELSERRQESKEAWEKAICFEGFCSLVQSLTK